MGANPYFSDSDLSSAHPDICDGRPSKTYAETVKRNSQRGKRRCQAEGCNVILSDANPGKFCFPCERKIRLERISGIDRRHVNPINDLNFDE